MTDRLRQIQEDVAGRLNADAYFTDLPVLVQRKGVIESDIETALNALNEKGSALGACVIVMMPSLGVDDPNIPGPRGRILQTVRVLENPLIAEGDTGAGKVAEAIALSVLQLLHHFIPYRVANVMVGDTSAILPYTEVAGVVGYDVTVVTHAGLRPTPKLPVPTITADSETAPADVTIACANASAAVYYTTDGSYPSSANAAATLYSAPFTQATAATIRAAAELTNYQQSDVALLNLS